MGILHALKIMSKEDKPYLEDKIEELENRIRELENKMKGIFAHSLRIMEK